MQPRDARADILVTGATGTVGAEVVQQLAEHGQPVRAAVRNPETAAVPEGARPVRFDFMEPETFSAALRGVKRLFLMRPPAVAWVERHLFPFIEAAEAAGARHVVFLSVIGAEKNPLVPHRRVEKRLAASQSLDATFVRPAFFMQNLLTAQGAGIRERGEIFVPAGRGRTAFVDARDVAAVAARALTEAGQAGRAYDLTGAEALTYFEVAGVLADVLRRPVVYANPSLPAYLWREWRRGRPSGYVLVTAALYTAARWGLSARLAVDETRRVLGRPPTALRAFAEEHAAQWQP